MKEPEHIPNPAALKLEAWATKTWLEQLPETDNRSELERRLIAVLAQGVDYAKNGLGLKMSKGNTARLILVGVSAAKTHDVRVLEQALGVAFPPEVKNK